MLKSYESSRYFQTPNQGLQAYFSRVKLGQPEVYRTPWYNEEDPQTILNRWLPRVESLSREWPTLVEYEMDLAKKVGPMSVMKPLSERITDIEAYYEGILLPSEPISEKAIRAVLSEWSQARGLRVRSQQRTVESMKLSTNSGSPYFGKRRVVLEDTVPARVAQRGSTIQCIGPNDEMWDACAVLGWRGQEGGPNPEDVKQRVVWMFPFAVNICELQFYQVAIEAAQKSLLVPAWVSMDAVSDRITQLFDTKEAKDLVVCTDFSKFDQHFGPACQEAAKTIIAAQLAPGSEDWLRDVFPIKYHIPLAISMEKMFFGHHGMGSGSGGTNYDETVVHRSLQYEAAQSSGKRLNTASQCLGDDGCLSYPGIRVEDVVDSYTRHGLEMNPDKQYASTDDCTYLRRWYHKDYRVKGKCVGVYSTARAIGRLAELERFTLGWGKEAVALRQLSIIENCKYHPLREEFARFCMKGDAYRLGLDIPGFLEHIQSIARELINDTPDAYLSYNQQQMLDAGSGIGDWWIVKYLQSIA